MWAFSLCMVSHNGWYIHFGTRLQEQYSYTNIYTHIYMYVKKNLKKTLELGGKAVLSVATELYTFL